LKGTPRYAKVPEWKRLRAVELFFDQRLSRSIIKERLGMCDAVLQTILNKHMEITQRANNAQGISESSE